MERYREGKASLGLAAELADLTLGEMINVLAEYGVKSNLETEDYLNSPCQKSRGRRYAP